MEGAHEGAGVARFVDQRRPAVQADAAHGADHPVAAVNHHQQFAAQLDRKVVAGVGDLGNMGHRQPVAAEDLLDLQIVERLAGIGGGGQGFRGGQGLAAARQHLVDKIGKRGIGGARLSQVVHGRSSGWIAGSPVKGRGTRGPDGPGGKAAPQGCRKARVMTFSGATGASIRPMLMATSLPSSKVSTIGPGASSVPKYSRFSASP